MFLNKIILAVKQTKSDFLKCISYLMFSLSLAVFSFENNFVQPLEASSVAKTVYMKELLSLCVFHHELNFYIVFFFSTTRLDCSFSHL